MKRAFLILAAVLTLLGAFLPQQPAHAGSPAMTGVIQFNGTAHLPQFPCLAPIPGQFPCDGTFVGSVQGALSGVHTNTSGQTIPWAFDLNTAVGSQTLNVNFSYFDNYDPGAACAAGSARAEGTIRSPAFGAYLAGPIGGGLPVPAAIIGAEVDFDFTWFRVGTVATMAFSVVNVRVNVVGFGLVTVVQRTSGVSDVFRGINPPGSAAATFVPDPVEFNDRFHACHGDPSAIGELHATVAGIAWFNVAQP